MSGERRYRGEHPGAHHRNREIEAGAEPGGGEGGAAEAADDDRVRKTHRHLRQIGGGQRAGDSDGRAEFQEHVGTRGYPGKTGLHYFVTYPLSQVDVAIRNCVNSNSPLRLQQIYSGITRIGGIGKPDPVTAFLVLRSAAYTI
jgi:hypothetical protein